MLAPAVDIYTPSVRLPFAGILVGTSWLLGRQTSRKSQARSMLGANLGGRRVHLARGRAQWAPGRLMPVPSAHEVNSLPRSPPGEGWLYAWAWQDRAACRVRARDFPPGDAIVEDEATGASAIVPRRLRQALDIMQGRDRS
jgi:predicted PhzF superfamily epimerase YddE/YHI9